MKKSNMKKYSIEEIIDYCDKICKGYELISETKGAPISDLQDYVRHYQIEEWLTELKAFKELDLTPWEMKEMDEVFKAKCREVNELKKRLKSCTGAYAEGDNEIAPVQKQENIVKGQEKQTKLVKYDADGIKSTSGIRTSVDLDKLKELYENGVSQKKIAEILKTGQSNVSKLVNELAERNVITKRGAPLKAEYAAEKEQEKQAELVKSDTNGSTPKKEVKTSIDKEKLKKLYASGASANEMSSLLFTTPSYIKVLIKKMQANGEL